MIDQDAPHHARRNGIKVDAAVPVHVRIHQPQIRFVDQGGGGQGIAGTLGTQASPGHLMQRFIDDWHQLVQGLRIAAAPVLQEPRYRL